MSIFAKRLRQLRKEKDISQEELGKVLSLTKASISLYESGKREPDFETLQKIASFFNVTTDYLLGRTDNRKDSTPSIDDELNAIMRELGPDVTLQFYDLKGMSQEEKENLKIFLEGLKARRKEKKEK